MSKRRIALNITIHYLANHPGMADHLARWSWGEWRHIYEERGLTFDDAVKSYRDRANIDRVPLALVALDGAALVGTASLKEEDLDIRPDLGPWLGGVFVLPRWRRQGVASWLVRRAMEEGRRLKLQHLFLWTSSAESLYARLGWVTTERTEYCGRNIAIMQMSLGVGE